MQIFMVFARRENVELCCLWQELLCFFFLDEQRYSAVSDRKYSVASRSRILSFFPCFFFCGRGGGLSIILLYYYRRLRIFAAIYLLFVLLCIIIHMMSMYVCTMYKLYESWLNGWKLGFYAYFIKINKWNRNKSSVCQIESVLCKNEWAASYSFSYLTTCTFTIHHKPTHTTTIKKKGRNLQHLHQSRTLANNRKIESNILTKPNLVVQLLDIINLMIEDITNRYSLVLPFAIRHSHLLIIIYMICISIGLIYVCLPCKYPK